MTRRDLTTVLIAIAALAAAAAPIDVIHADSGPWHWIALLTGLALYAWLACGVGGVVWGAAAERGRRTAAARYEARMKAAQPLGPTRHGYRTVSGELAEFRTSVADSMPTDVPPVDPLAAERPRPEPEMHGRHAGDAEDKATYESTLAAWATSEEADRSVAA